MSFSDFDDDFDDILQSDEDIPKKPKASLVINTIVNDVEKIDKIETSPTIFINKEKKFKNDRIVDDDINHLIQVESGKSTVNQTKPAKSVLESLLNPSKELDDINFIFNKSNAQLDVNGSAKALVLESKPTEFSIKSENKSSAKNQQSNEVSTNSNNKRTVRFSTETLLEDDLDFDATLNRSRPQTAPNINLIDSSKPKFISRFEASEFDEDPIKINDNFKFNNSSNSSLWHESKTDDFTKISGGDGNQKIEISDYKNKDSNRSAPQKKLSEFMQSSQEELFSSHTERSRMSAFNDSIPTRPNTNSRRSSMEDLLDSRSKSSVNIFDDTDLGRRSSISKDIVQERPKTSYSRFEKTQRRTDAIIPTVISFDENSDYQIKIKHLEEERDELLYKIEKMVQRNSEEFALNEKSYKNRIEILEQNMQSKEKRLKEEIDFLSEQNKQKLKILEEERTEMRAELSRRQDEIENQKRQEISRIREQHKLEIDKVRLNHEDLIEKIKHAKTEEDTTLRLVQPTTIQLQSVLTQVSNGAQDLISIKQQLTEQLNHQIKEKDSQLKEKNEYLKQLEEKLDLEKEQNTKERERLQSLISKLDIQLKEQARTAEEERWFLRQEQNKLSALQSSLEKEKEQFLLEKDQNRLSNEKFRERVLEEQKQLFDQIYEEKRSMTEQRTKLSTEIFKWSETNQLTNAKKNQEMAELDGMKAAINSERKENDRIRTLLAAEREELLLKSAKLDSLSYEVQKKTEKLNLLEKELNCRQVVINDKEKHFLEIEARGAESLQKAQDLHSYHEGQISKIQKQLVLLNEKEQQVTKQRIEMEKLSAEFGNKEKSTLCSKCSGSLKANVFGGSNNNINKMSTVNGFGKRFIDNQFNMKFHTNLTGQEFRNSLEYSTFLTSQLEEEQLLHSIKLAADIDREYLNQERAYLDSLIA